MKNIKQGSSMVNRMAKRDPALYPLAFVMVGVAGACGYFFVSWILPVTSSTTDTTRPRSSATPTVICTSLRAAAWSTLGTTSRSTTFTLSKSCCEFCGANNTNDSSTAAFKYRYKTPQGHMEDAHPVLNSSTHKVCQELFGTVGKS